MQVSERVSSGERTTTGDRARPRGAAGLAVLAEHSVVRRGVYDGHRAAALAGVPYSTLQYWARKGDVVPTISPERVRYWSWLDLVKLRAVTWLRKDRMISMRKVREILAIIEAEGLADIPLIRLISVSESGEAYITHGATTYRADASRQIPAEEILHLVAPYYRGPDLLEPRPTLSIIPGKLSGEPHIRDTRISTLNIFALHLSGYRNRDILEFYPDISDVSIKDSIELESMLRPIAA